MSHPCLHAYFGAVLLPQSYSWTCIQVHGLTSTENIVQELCKSRGGRPGLSVLTSLLVSVDVKLY